MACGEVRTACRQGTPASGGAGVWRRGGARSMFSEKGLARQPCNLEVFLIFRISGYFRAGFGFTRTARHATLHIHPPRSPAAGRETPFDIGAIIRVTT